MTETNLKTDSLERKNLNKPLIENRFIEIETDLRTFEFTIIHNYSDRENLIKVLQNAINYLITTP